ncbi:MAG TPA: class I SAM-dependent methyltransferase [Casimicrobiaceae bacterium]|nr:class I SAM-dependent methyltransferase [Casimicrobiaceae bacterium]
MVPEAVTAIPGAVAAPSDPVESCLVCGGVRTERRFVQRGYPVDRCIDCGLQFVTPTPSAAELAAYYDRGYAVPLERYAAAGHRNAARIAELERWRPERGRLLEVGASYGHSLAAARERGWDVVGVELSPTASEHARSQLGLTVHTCALADAPLAQGRFDAVIMWHVLEHVRDPRDELLRLAGLLKPGGILGLRVPNIDSFGARIAGQWWPWMCPPAHLWFFSRTTLPRLVDACGFDVKQVATLRGDGNNLYQYALMAAGNGLNDLRVRLLGREPARAEPVQRAEAKTTIPSAAARSADPGAEVSPQEASGLLQKWLEILTRAQPVTNAMARGTRWVVEPLERRGWGDELLLYARRRG